MYELSVKATLSIHIFSIDGRFHIFLIICWILIELSQICGQYDTVASVSKTMNSKIVKKHR